MKLRFMWFWSLYAYCYDSLNKLMPYQTMIQQVIDCIPDHKPLRMLDAGCGTGNLLAATKTRRPNIELEGVDFSPAMLRRARMKAPGAVTRRVDLNKPLPYKSATFDVVVSVNAVYAVRDPKNTISELKRVLKKGGLLIISTPKAKAGLTKILIKHLTYAGVLKTIPSIINLLILAIFNVFILALGKSGEYHFMERAEIENLMQYGKITSSYSDQNWLVVLVHGQPSANESIDK